MHRQGRRPSTSPGCKYVLACESAETPRLSDAEGARGAPRGGALGSFLGGRAGSASRIGELLYTQDFFGRVSKFVSRRLGRWTMPARLRPTRWATVRELGAAFDLSKSGTHKWSSRVPRRFVRRSGRRLVVFGPAAALALVERRIRRTVRREQLAADQAAREAADAAARDEFDAHSVGPGDHGLRSIFDKTHDWPRAASSDPARAMHRYRTCPSSTRPVGGSLDAILWLPFWQMLPNDNKSTTVSDQTPPLTTPLRKRISVRFCRRREPPASCRSVRQLANGAFGPLMFASGERRQFFAFGPCTPPSGRGR